jgi:FKBP-type peptidyl-prolyl cis-trans isomerase 2
MASVRKGDRVKIHYKGTLKDGTVFESNFGGAPLEFSVGKGKVIKGFENAVLGMSPGETKTVVVKPVDGYGPRDPALQWPVPVAELPAGTAAAAGTEVSFQRPDGTRVEGRILKVDGETVLVDGNHPFAGRNLTFEIKLASIG